MNASPPVPPNWDEFLNAARQSVTPYHKQDVEPTTDEFQVISKMVNVPIFKLERVLNTSLWKKFVNERKELLTRKSEDLQLLTTLGLTEQEMLHRAHINVNFTSDRSVSDIKYNDNIALLFHGSRSKLDTVLTQGLDDRLGNGGLYGKGIYFSDSAQTSVGFDTNGALLIVAVFLGDCYSVDKLGKQNFVREPEKADGQKRNHEDLFFDSIVAKRGVAQGACASNEFIIFNRNQCCPLYLVTHRGTSAGNANVNVFGGNMFTLPPPPTLPAPAAQFSPNSMLSFFTNGIFGTNPPPPAPPLPPPPPSPQPRRGRSKGRGGGARTAATRRTYNNHVGGNTAPAAAVASGNPIPTLSSGAASAQHAPTSLPFQSAEFDQARKSLPPFVWTQRNGGGRLSPNHGQWPFLARTLFDLMKNDEVELTRRDPSATPAAGGEPIDEGERARKISKLVDLGFGDVDNNARVLEMFQFNLDATIDHMLTSQPGTGGGGAEEEWEDASKIAQVEATFTLADFVSDEMFDATDLSSGLGVPAAPVASNSELNLPPPAGAGSAISINVGQGQGQGSEGDQSGTVTVNQLTLPAQSSTAVIMISFEDCPICCVEYPSDSSDWRPLGCGHKLCTPCYSQLETKGTTMSGQSHVFLKCPFCQACSGQQIGDCPSGQMHVTQIASTLPGYKQYGTQVLTYTIHTSEHYLSRMAYLPSSPEGLRLVGLLRIAWDRRLIFTIGNSLTTGAQNTLVWNIHHKTSTHGGVQSHGYPDPTYLERLRDELKQYGIE